MEQKNTFISSIIHSKSFWPLCALLLLLCYSLVTDPSFFSIEMKEGNLFGSPIDILNRGAPTALLALGMMLVIATGGIDLSVGAIAAIAGAMSAYLVTSTNIESTIVIIAISLFVAAFAGLWNGFLVTIIGIQPFIATLILMISGRGIAQLITNGQVLTFEHEGLAFVGRGFLFAVPFSITIVIVFYIIAAIILKRTALGLFIEATGANETASYYVGIRRGLIKISTYVVSGICAGMAGIIWASNIQGADGNNAGLWSELDAILAVVIGGTSMMGGRFYLLPTLIGALILQTLTTITLSSGLPVQFTQIIKAIVVVVVMLLISFRFRQQFQQISTRRTNNA